MYNHEPNNYICPICIAISEKETRDTWIKQADIVYKDNFVTGFISSKFIKGNEGHILVVPNKHFENIYDIPEKFICYVFNVGKKIAVTLKEVRKCDGVNFVQNNEPVADQHAFHYHLHIIPRFKGDNFNEEFSKAKKSKPKDRIKYAKAIRKNLK
jgi:histidine triad (HIT) family protein